MFYAYAKGMPMIIACCCKIVLCRIDSVQRLFHFTVFYGDDGVCVCVCLLKWFRRSDPENV